MLKYIGLLVGVLALASIFLWQGNATAQNDDRIYVVTSIAQIADIAQNIGGEHLRIESLMGTGVDPHLYRPARSDVLKLKKADLVFYNGLHLEGQMVGLFHDLGAEKPAIAVGENIPQAQLISDNENIVDPHVWMDVGAWIEATNAVTKTLMNHDPAHAAEYKKRAGLYKHKLSLLDEHIQNVIRTIPADKRILITAHDAFGYFGKAYDIEVIGIQGLSTESEAGLRKMETLVNLLVERQIPAIFTETSVTDRNIKALIAGAAAKGHKVELGGALYSDAMGVDGTYEGTYIGMIEHNVRTLTKALGGTPDPFIYNNQVAAGSTDILTE